MKEINPASACSIFLNVVKCDDLLSSFAGASLASRSSSARFARASFASLSSSAFSAALRALLHLDHLVSLHALPAARVHAHDLLLALHHARPTAAAALGERRDLVSERRDDGLPPSLHAASHEAHGLPK